MMSGRKVARGQATLGIPCSFVATSVKDLSDTGWVASGRAAVEADQGNEPVI